MRLVGFIGTEKLDFILIASKIATMNNCPVLVADFSDEQEISHSIPNYDHIDVFNFNGVDFISQESTLEKVSANYKIIFMNFGFKVNHPFIARCNEVFIISDTKRYNVERIIETKLFIDQERFLILRDRDSHNGVLGQVLTKFETLDITAENTLYADDSDEDWDNRYSCMYRDMFHLKTPSPEYSTVIYTILAPYLLEKDMVKSMKSLVKGGQK